MNARKIWIVGTTAVGVAGIMLAGGLASAGSDSKHHEWKFECSNKMLRGTYGIQMQGTRPIPGGGTETVIGVVLRTYDGRGNFNQIDNIKGAVSGMVADRPGSGTYQVNPDCSGTTSFAPGPGALIEERIVVLEYGNEIRSITATPAPLMVSAIAKRIGFR
jgi:hypothetical protein